MLERVQKILASAGVASRRKCEELIAEGRVFVNDKHIKLGDKADSSKDRIRVDNNLISLEKKVYFLVNKPKRYLTSVSDELGRKTVVDILGVKERVFPVGRLDRDAHGLVFLTNDGEIANRIMHPSYGVEKTYIITVREKEISFANIEKLKRGVKIFRRKFVPPKVVVLARNKVEITLHEGRKHIIKKVFFKLGYFVTDLFRTKIANLSVDGIGEGKFRVLSDDELVGLRRHLQLL